MRVATGPTNRKTVSFETSTAQNLDLECTRLWNLVLPLRDSLRRASEAAGQGRNTAEVLYDFVKAVHEHRVNALTMIRKCPYSRRFARIGKLAYMPQTEKRELDPRALSRGGAIIDARKRQKMSQEDVAQALGVTREAVSNWERGVVGEIERRYRLGLGKLLGIEERELLLDPANAEPEFAMPLSNEAKSIAYRWDDLPEAVRAEIKGRMAQVEQMLKNSPDYARVVFPELQAPKS